MNYYYLLICVVACLTSGWMNLRQSHVACGRYHLQHYLTQLSAQLYTQATDTGNIDENKQTTTHPKNLQHPNKQSSSHLLTSNSSMYPSDQFGPV